MLSDSFLKRLFRLILSVVLVSTSVLVGAAVAGTNPAGAAQITPLGVTYEDVMYGDFLEVGNGNLRCPAAGETGYVSAADSANCVAGQARTLNSQNNNYYMTYGDVDSDPATVNSSRATVTIPPGATVQAAQLDWGGTTGKVGSNGAVTANGCTAGAPVTLPARDPGSKATAVRFTVGGQAAVSVAPAALTVTTGAGLGTNDPQYFSARADVTAQFTGVDTGTPLTVTTADIPAAQGKNCSGGWSLYVAYSYPTRNATFAPSLRRVWFYDGQVVQRANEAATTVTVNGFKATAPRAHVGVTAYEGDYGITGDDFLINGTKVAEPLSGATGNFFVSNADRNSNRNATGGGTPDVPNNMSVDAKDFNSTLIPAGSTSATLGFVTAGDGYVVQGVALSLPVPELKIVKTVSSDGTSPGSSSVTVHPGAPLTWTIEVTNNSGADARNVVVSDPQLAGTTCANRSLGTVPSIDDAPANYVKITCTSSAGTANLTNLATVTGTSETGEALTDSSTASVIVLNPALSITKKTDAAAYHAGDTVTFTITVTNTGDAALHAIAVTDPKSASCASSAGTPTSLVPGASFSYTCTATAPLAGDANTATVSGVDALGRSVSDSATAPVPLIHPAITIAKTRTSAAVVHAGDPVSWRLVVTNTGDVGLHDVSVNDPTASGCSTVVGTLAAGAAAAPITCTSTASTASATNTAQVTGTDPVGGTVTDTDSATVTVVTPALTITKAASPAAVHAGDTVTFTIVVTNVGDVNLHDVAVTDPQYPQCAQTLTGIAVGQDVTLSCSAVAGAASFTNTVTASGTDDIGGVVSDSAQAAVTVLNPAVTIAKTADASAYHQGDTVTFTIRVTNTGDTALSQVSVSDPTTASCANVLPAPTKLAAGASFDYTCTATAPLAGDANTATVNATDALGRTVSASATVAVPVIHPGIELTKTATSGTLAHVGDTITWQVAVHNTGDVALHNVIVSDATAPGCAVLLVDLAPGATADPIACTSIAGADVTNTATVSGTDPLGGTVSGSGSATVDVITPSIELTKTATPTVVHPGDPVTFTIIVHNTGDAALHAVTITDPAFPQCSQALDDLAAGQTVPLSCTVTAGQQDFSNTATVSGTDPLGQVVDASGQAAVTVIHPSITVVKTAPTLPIVAGDQVGFTLVVTNSGDVPLTDVSVDDPTATCATTTIGSLAPGEASAPIACVATMTATDLSNTATASGTDPLGSGTTGSGTAVAPAAHPAVTLTKAADAPSYLVGATITFTLTASNTGDVALSGVSASDPSLPACDRTIGALAVGQVVTWTCTAPAVLPAVTNTASITGIPAVQNPSQHPVGDTATVTVPVNSVVVNPPGGGGGGGTTNPPGGGTTNPPGGGTTNPPSGTTNPPSSVTNPPSLADTGAAVGPPVTAAVLLIGAGAVLLGCAVPFGRRRRSGQDQG
ncbi:DUF11 domain-containing protein [Jatrophihabitans telluris]|uniref:DUF11 domain-containing protein n=1 Tax=Jatrophihabitans telluris TaxID=2038343 RepID=A0ABY4QTY8_9ACTN|nr:DUF11 domain-containing protein [Jatrophihabitans telluris]UQX86903.1 DUF11 domain-containing protein [Jatrophihabitans telluris]